MILLTIGTQLPFDRLVRALDEIAPSLSEEIFGQIGMGAKYFPRNFSYCLTMQPKEFDERFGEARVIVSHAGIGSLLSARKHGKPIVIVPRQVRFGEHRNDHQLATCEQLRGRQGIYVAPEVDMLEQILRQQSFSRPAAIEDSEDRDKLLTGIREFTKRLPTFNDIPRISDL